MPITPRHIRALLVATLVAGGIVGCGDAGSWQSARDEYCDLLAKTSERVDPKLTRAAEILDSRAIFLESVKKLDTGSAIARGDAYVMATAWAGSCANAAELIGEVQGYTGALGDTAYAVAAAIPPEREWYAPDMPAGVSLPSFGCVEDDPVEAAAAAREYAEKIRAEAEAYAGARACALEKCERAGWALER